MMPCLFVFLSKEITLVTLKQAAAAPQPAETHSCLSEPSPRLPPPLAASHVEGLPPKVLLTITKLQCMLESKQERIAALERQVEDLMQDRKFLRTQIENLTSSRSLPFASPSPLPEGWCPKRSCTISQRF